MRLRALLALAAAAGVLLGAAWPSYRGDPANSGAAPGPPGPPGRHRLARLALIPAWTYHGGSWITSTPTVANGLVYAGTWDGRVVALDAATGDLRWSVALGANPDSSYGQPRGVIASVAVAGQRAFAISGSCIAAALDAGSGRELWRRQICSVARNDDTYASPVVAGDTVLFGIDLLLDRPTDRGALIALDADTGVTRWRFDPVRYHGTGCGISATPAVDTRRGVAFVGIGNPTPRNAPPPGPDPLADSIVALDLQSGRARWVYGPVHPHDTGDRDFFASPNRFSITVNGRVRDVVGEGNKDGTYYVVDARTGAEVWRRTVVPEAPYAMIVGTAAVAGGRVAVPVYQNDELGWLVVLEASDGRIVWRKRMRGVYEAPLLWGAAVFVTQADGTLAALRLEDGATLARREVGRPLHGRGPSAAGDALFVAAGSRLHAFAIDATSGSAPRSPESAPRSLP